MRCKRSTKKPEKRCDVIVTIDDRRQMRRHVLKVTTLDWRLLIFVVARVGDLGVPEDLMLLSFLRQATPDEKELIPQKDDTEDSDPDIPKEALRAQLVQQNPFEEQPPSSAVVVHSQHLFLGTEPVQS
ncbi:hypothetical protein BLNAU_3183 [Blattamonas nauphoetae]|uniref:Uncharacterized protein n=1 Tax=Blattamonas nauphoetae TaxID=2049346 RepID=A0ABQ9YDM1_9EUKA|nr:hypothetical protein BLNAU_3183 [Blattamonas nauphoetae]